MQHHTSHSITANLIAAALCSTSLLSASAFAQSCPAGGGGNIFNLSLCVDGEIANVGGNTIEGILDQIDTEALKQRFANYDEDTAAGEFRLDLRGLPVTLSYGQNSSQLVFAVPSIGINEVFDGGTRDASNDLLEDYIKKNGDSILKKLTEVSPIDPVAGNPASLQSQMAAGDFSAGVDAVTDTLAPGSSFGVAARFGSYTVDGLTQNVFTLPISYSYTFSNYDRLIVRAPITYMEVDGAESYQGSIGLGYRKNILPSWSVTPAINYGITGSADLGAAGQIFSASVTSDLLVFASDKFRINMGNMAGYYLSIPTSVSDYSVDYDLENTMVRNGLLVSMPLQKSFWNREFSVDFFVTDTRFFGDALYSEYYQEIGISIGPMRSRSKMEPNVSSHPFGLGIKYTTGDGDVEGFELNFAYRF